MIRLSKSCLSAAEKQAVMKVLDEEFLGMGLWVKEFEDALSEFFGRPARCVSNGTAALQLAIEACDIGPGDEVLVPSLTYVASFQAISATGAKAVACDVDLKTLLIDLKDAESRITKFTKAIMPVHYAGQVVQQKELDRLSKKYGLRVIEDAAHAFGSVADGKRVGNSGDITCFSFDGIKNITSGEGGCVVTNDTAVLQRIEDARLLGVERDSVSRYSGSRSWEFDVKRQGWRYHMSNIMAAIGIEQLRRFDHLAKVRQQLAHEYDRLLKNHSRISYLASDYSLVVPHIYPVRILGLKNRTMLQELMLASGVQTGVHYQPNHWLSLYKGTEQPSIQNVDEVYPELLTLPMHPDLSINDVRAVVKALVINLEECCG